MSLPCRATPRALVDAVRARITPLFPDWDRNRIEALVCQIAAVEWRYSVGSDSESRRADVTRHAHDALDDQDTRDCR